MATRALIFLLLMLNAGAALWWMARPAPQVAPAAPQPPGAVRLQLLAETPAAAAPLPDASAAVVVEAPAEPPADIPSAPHCHALGPFASAAAATDARARLPARGVRAAIREAEAVARAWRVSMLPLADREAAAAMADRLRGAGFQDLYVMSEGPLANGIALGRFGTEAAARRHAGNLQAAGFEAQVQPEGAAAARYWIDAVVEGQGDAEALRHAVGAAQAVPLDCARAAR